jgi:hypothetical protein
MTVDLLTPLEPPREDVERLSGTVRGLLDGLGAGLEIWCGPSIGWRAVGEVLGGGQGVVMRHLGRLSVSFSFDLGEAPPMRRHGAEDDEGAE